MPRISAKSVPEHVAKQKQRVFSAAIELFVAEGYENVHLGDIASEVGLARNSLYRYFPSKAHIMVEWFRIELPSQTKRSAAALGGPGAANDRLQAWIEDQLDYARQPEHTLVASLPQVIPDLDAETKAEFASSHQLLLEPLNDLLIEAGISDPSERDVIVGLIGGLILAAANHEASHGESPAARRLCYQAIAALIGLAD